MSCGWAGHVHAKADHFLCVNRKPLAPRLARYRRSYRHDRSTAADNHSTGTMTHMVRLGADWVLPGFPPKSPDRTATQRGARLTPTRLALRLDRHLGLTRDRASGRSSTG